MTQKQIILNIDLDMGLKSVAQAFTELASIKLERIRNSIEKNRLFFEEISGLFEAVAELANKKRVVPKLEKKGTAAIILTSNSRFYGGLERRLMQFYQQTISKLNTEQIIIGLSAANFFQKPGLILKSDLPSDTELTSLTDTIKHYSRVLVFYPRFQSVLLQTPFIVDLTESGTITIAIAKKPTKFPIDYILEPELTKMWQFFDSQILKLLLEQTFLEAELARTAARLTSMDQAQDNADHAIIELKKALAEAKRSINNSRILETESAIFRFRRHI